MVRTTTDDDRTDDECDKCGHEGTDVEACGESWEEEVVVSRGRRHPQTGEYMNRETRTRHRGFSVDLCASCREDVDFVETHDTDEDREPVTDGGRPPRSSFDHAPGVGAGDVDKCRECGRYAPHAFDHAPECSRFESIDDELSSRTAASNSRMVRPATDGGDTVFDKPAQSPERIASEIVASEVGDDVVVWCGHGDHSDTLSVFEGEVVSTGYKDHADKTGGTHVVAIDVAGDRVAVHFDRVVDTKFEGNLSTPHAELFNPEHGDRLPVTRFDGVDG